MNSCIGLTVTVTSRPANKNGRRSVPKELIWLRMTVASGEGSGTVRCWIQGEYSSTLSKYFESTGLIPYLNGKSNDKVSSLLLLSLCYRQFEQPQYRQSHITTYSRPNGVVTSLTVCGVRTCS